MMLGIAMLQKKIAALPDFPADLAIHLKHLILSHHGRYDFGSPVLPMIQEAFILHLLDDLDAKVNYFDRLSQQADGQEYGWTDFQRTMERFLYVKGRPGQPETSPPAEQEVMTPQPPPSSEPPSAKGPTEDPAEPPQDSAAVAPTDGTKADAKQTSLF